MRMPKTSDILNWRQAKSIIRIASLNGNRNIDENDFVLEFTDNEIVVTLGERTVRLAYTAHYICDMEMVADLMVCNLDESSIHDPTKFISYREDESSMIPSLTLEIKKENLENLLSRDLVLYLLTPHIHRFQMYNNFHYDLDDKTTAQLTTISNRIKDMIQDANRDNVRYHLIGNDLMISDLLTCDEYYESTKSENINTDLKIMYYYMDKETRGYFLSDCEKMSDNKLRYIFDQLLSYGFEGFGGVTHAYYDYMNRDISKQRSKEWIGTVYKSLATAIPNTIEDFPYRVFDNRIPSIATKPKTNFNWLLTNVAAKSHTLNYESCMGVPGKPDIKLNTEQLLPYIQCPVKAFELFIEYEMLEKFGHDGTEFVDDFLDAIDEIAGKSLKDYVDVAVQHEYIDITDIEPIEAVQEKFDVECITKYLRAFLTFINDGRDIKETFPDEMTLSDGTVIKMATVEGTLLKQVRNSIYNHHEEKKISIEEKYRLLDVGEEMESLVEVPQALIPFHIRTKKHLIFSGKELGHCIGGKTASKNLFFRRGTVCAEVTYNEDTFIVSTCLDAKNHHTEAATEFKEFLEESLRDVTPVYKEVPDEEG